MSAELIGQAGIALLAAVIAVLYVAAPPEFIPESDRGLVRIATYADPSMVELERGVALADAGAAPDTAILVLGSHVSWHDPLWAPTWTDRRLFYDDWLWYWQREHVGDYDVDTEHTYRSDASALDPAYLATHGIGAIVVGHVGGGAAGDAASSPWLSSRFAGRFYDVYLVEAPTTFATLAGQDVATTGDGAATISVATGGLAGPLVVRTNWFPRWQASVDGEGMDIRHRSDGYIEVDVPPGVETVTLTYAVTRLDWLARLLCVASAVTVLGLLLASRLRPTARSAPR